MKKMSALLVLIIIAVVLSYIFIVVNQDKQDDVVQNTDVLQVVVSFYPLAEFSQHIGGAGVNITNLTPAGVEPHDFEPTARDIAMVQQADVFVYNGAGFEPWVEKILPDIENKGVIVVNSSSRVKLLPGNDPHIWLDPQLAREQVDAIKDGFIAADSLHTSAYELNATQYKKKLADLDTDFRKALSNCATRTVVVSHEAFGYMAIQYNLHVVSLAGLSPDEEPSLRKMAEVVEFAKKNNVRYIFFETLVSPRLSETIALEIDAETLVFNPLEGLTPEDNALKKDYISIQQENLANLKKALDCK